VPLPDVDHGRGFATGFKVDIMNPFTEHTKQQGITYWQHYCFAFGIAVRLFNSVSAFALHAIFPFIDIERRLDLEATSAFLLERNNWIKNAAGRQRDDDHDRIEDASNPVPVIID
jgi:hypothetical protein